MCLDESADIGFQFRRGPMDTALQLLARQLCTPSFDLIDPGGRCWGAVNMPMRAARQPGLYFRCLVGGIIVHHEMNIRPLRPLRHLRVDPLEKGEKFACPVTFGAFADHGTGGDVERCGCRPNAAQIRRIVVCDSPASAAIERIDQWAASFGVVCSVRSIT